MIGTGKIGGTIGRAFAGAGHDVTFGSRRPYDDPVAGDTAAAVRDVRSAAEAGEIVALAVPGTSVADVAADLAETLGGKLVIDCANNLGARTAHSRDQIVAAAAGVRYARAFNTLGVENLADPVFGDEVSDMFFSSTAADRATVEELIRAVGLRPVYVGDGEEDTVDGVLRLWLALALRQGWGRHLGVRLLT